MSSTNIHGELTGSLIYALLGGILEAVIWSLLNHKGIHLGVMFLSLNKNALFSGIRIK